MSAVRHAPWPFAALELSQEARAALAQMPEGFDPHAPAEDLGALYREAYAMRKAVP